MRTVRGEGLLGVGAGASVHHPGGGWGVVGGALVVTLDSGVVTPTLARLLLMIVPTTACQIHIQQRMNIVHRMYLSWYR